MILEHGRERYELPTLQLGTRVAWIDAETFRKRTGYVNGYWGSTSGTPVPLLYGVVVDPGENGEPGDSAWLHLHQVELL